VGADRQGSIRFDTDDGSASLADLFQRCSQLIVYDFMFGPDWKVGCPSCSMIADAFIGAIFAVCSDCRLSRSLGEPACLLGSGLGPAG
jgi:predicted dithiol-disulfide oxidoreductase (DUF899 family)